MLVRRIGRVVVVATAVGLLFAGGWSPARTAGDETPGHATTGVTGRYTHIGVSEPADAVAHRTQPPTVMFVAPSASMGDYGANHGNVWDMAEPEPTDIIRRQENFPVERRPASEGTVVRGSTGSQVLGMAFWGSSETTFPASQYHHMVFRLKIQAQSNCWTNGRVAYARNWPYWYGSHTSSYPYVPHIDPMNCPYGTFCTYYIDLARNNNWPAWPTWRSAKSPTDPSSWLRDPVKTVALVPNEICVGPGMTPIGVPQYFELDFVYLTGDIVARAEDGYRYSVRYNIEAPDSAVVTATIRYQELHEMVQTGQQPPCNANNWNRTWRDFNPIARRVKVIRTPDGDPPDRPGQQRVYLPVISTASGHVDSEGYQINLSDSRLFADGKSYYLCIEADDGVSRTYQGSDTPIVRVPRSPWFGPN